MFYKTIEQPMQFIYLLLYNRKFLVYSLSEQVAARGNSVNATSLFARHQNRDLKVMPATFLLVCFVSLKESTFETRTYFF